MNSTLPTPKDAEINKIKLDKKSKKKSKKSKNTKEPKKTPILTKDAETGRLLGWMGLN